jgi:hypothetical protein
MRRRTFVGGGLACLVLTLVVAGGAAAQTADDDNNQAPVVVSDAPPALFVRIVEPADELEVPLSTTTLTVRGETLPGADVSVDAQLVDAGDDGTFSATVSLDPGANVIDVVASTEDGSTTDTSLLVIRGTE